MPLERHWSCCALRAEPESSAVEGKEPVNQSIAAVGFLTCVSLGTFVTGGVADETRPSRARHVADFIHSSRPEGSAAAALSFVGPRLGDANGAHPLFGSFSGPVGEGVSWLEANQNPDDSWGTDFPLTVTATVIESLTEIDPGSPSRGPGAAWLSSQSASNYEFLARQIIALAGIPGYETLVSDLASDLLAGRNPAEPDPGVPNYPEGGWGLDAGFETDCLTTAMAMLALDAAGFNGGFAVIAEPVGAGQTDVHPWVIAANATKVRIVISVSGSTVRLRMRQGMPPGPGDPFFSLPPGTWLIVFPDSGLPFTPGQNFISVQNVTGTPATYTMTASYETPTFDTRTLAEPLAYLRESQNVDGGWGLQRGQPTEFYTTLHVLFALVKFQNYDFSTEQADGIAYVESQQLGDGSFGYDGVPIPYVTALAALSLIRADSFPFSTAIEDAVDALLLMHDMDGSWDQEAYDTALAILAIWEHNQAPTANAGPDQNRPDTDENCVETVTLAGSGTDLDGTIVSYVWTENGEQIATGQSPMVTFTVGVHTVVLTVTDDIGETDTDPVVINVIGTGVPTNQCHCCLADGGCEVFDPDTCAPSGGTPIPGACAITACCMPDLSCNMFDVDCCILEGGTPSPGQDCLDPFDPFLACCLPDGSCSMLDPVCCGQEGGVVQDPEDLCTELEACCLPDDTCADLDPLCCSEEGGASQGPGTACTLEACCLPDDSCENVDPLCCVDRGGVPSGPGSACTLQACCLPDDSCENLDPVCCEDAGGMPRGVGTACTAPQACCFGNDTCQNLDPECCEEQGGTPLGGMCLGNGACCRSDGTCDIVDGACCANDGDEPQGPATICAPQVACCFLDGTCDDLAPVCCADAGGTGQAPGSVCLGDLDMDDVDDACLTTPDPPIGGDNTCQTAGADTGIPCETDADCAEPAECGLKSRYISITPANPATATSIRVRVLTAPQFPAIVGHVFYAGPEVSIANSPNPALRGAPLQCVGAGTPHSQIWTTGVLHLFGASIVPTTNTSGVTTYAIAHCDANGDNCSVERNVEMAKWGDVVRPFTGGAQPNFGDVSAIVAKFGNVASAPNTARTDIVGPQAPGTPNTPNQATNFADVSNDVSAFSGFAYPYTVTLCPP